MNIVTGVRVTGLTGNYGGRSLALEIVESPKKGIKEIRVSLSEQRERLTSVVTK